MPISPLMPILILLAGAFLLRLGSLVHFRWSSLILVIATGASAAAMLLLVRQLPVTAVALDWRPVTLFGSTVSLRVDETAWLLGMALLLSGFSAGLMWWVVPGQSPSAPYDLACAMLAVGLGSVFAANLLTIALCWGILDALFCVVLLARDDPASGRRAQLALSLSGLATLIIWVVVLLVEQDRLSLYWHLLILPPTARILMGVAATLRLSIYPLRAWRRVEQNGDLDRTILVHLIPAMTGLALWARLAIICAASCGQGLPERDAWPAMALALALIGGLLAWVQSDPRQSVSHLALGYGGMFILAATVGKASAAALAAGSMSWLLGLTLLCVGRPLSRATWPWAIPTALGAAMLAGLPFTPGSANRFAFYQNISAGPQWMFFLALIAEIFLIGAMLRRLITPDANPVPCAASGGQGAAARMGYAAALMAAVVPVLVFGVTPLSSAMPTGGLSALAWIGWGAPFIGAAVLAIAVEPARARLSDWEAQASHILRLDQLYSFLLPLMRGPARLGLLVADLLEGDGAFLWMLLILALVMIYLRGSLTP